MPLPDEPATVARDWYGENQLAIAVQGVCQFLSVSALAFFVIRLRRISSSAGQVSAASRADAVGPCRRRPTVLASVFAWSLAAVAADASLDTVSALRTANFVAGGAAHVLALGVFAVLASRVPGMSKPVRALSYTAAVPALLSPLSLVWVGAGAFILLGRRSA